MGRKVKAVYFNTVIEAQLLEFANDLSNFSEWVKEHIRWEIRARETGIDPAVEQLVERLLETKLAGRVIAVGQVEEKVDVVGEVDAFF